MSMMSEQKRVKGVLTQFMVDEFKKLRLLTTKDGKVISVEKGRLTIITRKFRRSDIRHVDCEAYFKRGGWNELTFYEREMLVRALSVVPCINPWCAVYDRIQLGVAWDNWNLKMAYALWLNWGYTLY